MSPAAFAGIFLMAGLARAFNPSRTIKLALLPRATAGLLLTEGEMRRLSHSSSLGDRAGRDDRSVNGSHYCQLLPYRCDGSSPALVDVMPGIAGANFGPKLLDLFGQRDPIGKLVLLCSFASLLQSLT